MGDKQPLREEGVFWHTVQEAGKVWLLAHMSIDQQAKKMERPYWADFSFPPFSVQDYGMVIFIQDEPSSPQLILPGNTLRDKPKAVLQLVTCFL